LESRPQSQRQSQPQSQRQSQPQSQRQSQQFYRLHSECSELSISNIGDLANESMDEFLPERPILLESRNDVEAAVDNHNRTPSYDWGRPSRGNHQVGTRNSGRYLRIPPSPSSFPGPRT
jgi:hypothetical protein